MPTMRASTPSSPETIRFAIGECSLGFVLVARTAAGLRALLLGEDATTLREALRDRFPRAALHEDGSGLAALVAEVRAFVDAPANGLDAPLDPGGTEFQRTVWRALREIPAGRTATYTEIATRIGRPTAARAVAQACAANPLAIVVPCHRVVGRDGALTGYRWGIERKRALLDRESGG